MHVIKVLFYILFTRPYMWIDFKKLLSYRRLDMELAGKVETSVNTRTTVSLDSKTTKKGGEAGVSSSLEDGRRNFIRWWGGTSPKVNIFSHWEFLDNGCIDNNFCWHIWDPPSCQCTRDRNFHLARVKGLKNLWEDSGMEWGKWGEKEVCMWGGDYTKYCLSHLANYLN